MSVAPPMALLAELTHRCPLACPYCSNPLALDRASDELDTEGWKRVLDQAAALGVLQVHFSGGEPMARRDLEALVAHARGLDLYSNLITSGVTLTEARLAALVAAGLDHVQLSFQDVDADNAERIGGLRGAQARKLAAARLIRAADVALTVNFVVHRQNVGNVGAMIALAAELGARRVEIAHTQYYGWGLANRDALLPSAAQLEAATAAVEAARPIHAGRMAIDYVTPDYHATQPKPCMGGWAQRFINVSPAGRALPCHAAETIPDMAFPSVREHALADIWERSEAFTRFRGTGWMPAECQSCALKERDWGGCRCQALALAGDAAASDPVCDRSPHHRQVLAALAASDAPPPPLRYRARS
ncbi:pyrroloquinoline quinone biosynthesis protein PqqE [Roseomonas sp. USHLN139]|uniref:pyrroloquinoline quinone biosynthesis protein PqqE n=1 Tax=Roseomonas sp. USHLN139 TaxID=3081298 RepID=UPI003B0221F6